MKMKKPLLLFLALSFMGAMANEPGVTFLFNDGKTASFLFSTQPKVTVGSEELTVSSTDVSSVSYTIANVQRFYFEENIATAIPKADAASSGNHPVFAYAGETVTVSGLKAGERVTVVSVNGKVLQNVQADSDGKASLHLGGVPAGVYVTSTEGGVSFKLLKK